MPVEEWFEDDPRRPALVSRRVEAHTKRGPAAGEWRRTMIVRLVLWNLADSKTTIGELRRYLRDESVAAFAEVPGLRFKAWISDEVTERWGAVYVWESRQALEQALPSRARELIGREPDIAETFDVEATVEGLFEVAELSRRGLAFEA